MGMGHDWVRQRGWVLGIDWVRQRGWVWAMTGSGRGDGYKAMTGTGGSGIFRQAFKWNFIRFPPFGMITIDAFCDNTPYEGRVLRYYLFQVVKPRVFDLSWSHFSTDFGVFYIKIHHSKMA